MIDAEHHQPHRSLTGSAANCLVPSGNIDAEIQKAVGIMLSAAQSRAARALIEWHQSRLATAAQVSVGTVRNFEAGRGTPIAATLNAIQRALEDAGVEFLDDDGVKLRPKS